MHFFQCEEHFCIGARVAQDILEQQPQLVERGIHRVGIAFEGLLGKLQLPFHIAAIEHGKTIAQQHVDVCVFLPQRPVAKDRLHALARFVRHTRLPCFRPVNRSQNEVET